MCKGLKDWMEKERKAGEARGAAMGEARGKNQMLELIRCMSENGEADLIPKISEDKAFLEDLLQKYHIWF